MRAAGNVIVATIQRAKCGYETPALSQRMTFPPYIIFKTGGTIYICSTIEPHYLCAVVHKPTEYWVPGYDLWLSFGGTLGGNRILMGDRPHGIVMQALEWYTGEVAAAPERYKKMEVMNDERRQAANARKLKRQQLATELIQVYQGDINYEFELEILAPYHLRLIGEERTLDYWPQSCKGNWVGTNEYFRISDIENFIMNSFKAK